MHPDSSSPTLSPLLCAQDFALIREHAAASDKAGMLTPALQQLVHERGWLRMLAPKAAGGGELPLPDAVRLEEALAAADGSMGWTVTLCAGAGWFAGFLRPDFARAILDTPRMCVGGSGAPAGFADIEGDGYRLSGRWDFATGAPMTTHFTLNAVIRDNGEPLLDERGNPALRAFIVPAELVWVHETWRCTGLRATASHTFSIDRMWLGQQHAFDISPKGATAGGPLFRFPFLSLAFVTLAANVAGMAAGFIELAEPVIARRRHPLLDRPLNELPQAAATIGQARSSLSAARGRFYDLLDTMWDQVVRGQPVESGETHRLHLASIELVDTARRAVDELYPFCGLHAADELSDIGRIWRDLHTATQHKMLLPLP